MDIDEQALDRYITGNWGEDQHIGDDEFSADIDEVLAAIGNEVGRAESMHAPLHSAHEAYAVILEELDEVKAEVWKKHLDRAALRKELIQCAAMCVRTILNLELGQHE